MPTFNNPQDDVDRDSRFKGREVGLNHPDLPSFIKLTSNGDIEIVAGDGLSIILNPHSRSITFVADHVKFMTKHEDGLRWNRLSFNERATNFNEPTLVEVDDAREGYGLYKGVDHYSPEAEEQELTAKDDIDDIARKYQE